MKSFKIPARLKIKNKVVYEIVWVESFADPDVLCECRFDSKQIALKQGQSEREIMKTLIHEILHCMEFEREIKIAHKSVYQLEDAIYYLLFHNIWKLK
jgi:hypothetical protein